MKKLLFFTLLPLAIATSFPVLAVPSCPLPQRFFRVENPQGKVLYRVRSKTDTYDYWQVSHNREGQTLKFVAVIRRDSKGKCYLADEDSSGEAGTMTKGVPRSVAKAFALKLVQDSIKTNGRDAIQSNLDKMGRDDVMGQEMVDALTSLNFKVPSNIRVDRYWNGPLRQETYK